MTEYGIQQGLIMPLKGIGPSGTRNTCATLDTNLPKWLPGKNYCGNHPHNFYIQFLSELGFIGFSFLKSSFTGGRPLLSGVS